MGASPQYIVSMTAAHQFKSKTPDYLSLLYLLNTNGFFDHRGYGLSPCNRRKGLRTAIPVMALLQGLLMGVAQLSKEMRRAIAHLSKQLSIAFHWNRYTQQVVVNLLVSAYVHIPKGDTSSSRRFSSKIIAHARFAATTSSSVDKPTTTTSIKAGWAKYRVQNRITPVLVHLQY